MNPRGTVIGLVSLSLATGPTVWSQRDEGIADYRKSGVVALHGVIVAADSQRPVRNAEVQLRGTDGVVWMSVSDAAGRYEFTRLPASVYTVVVAAPGFLPWSLSVTLPQSDTCPSNQCRVNFQLVRPGVISGRVLGESNQPIPRVAVRALRINPMGWPPIVPQGSSDTDDLGRFRVTGLPSGRYHLELAPALQLPVSRNGVSNVYGPSYYPGPEVSANGGLEVRAGESLAADVVLSRQPMAVVRGRIRTPEATLETMRVAVARVSGGVVLPTPANVVTAGVRFETSLFPGTYLITVRYAGERPGDEPIYGSTLVSTNPALDEVEVVVGKTLRARGRLLLPPAKLSAAEVRAMKVVALTSDSDLLESPEFAAQVLSDASFNVRMQQRLSFIRVLGLPPDWSVRSVMLGDRDVTTSGFVPTQTQQLIHVQLGIRTEF